MTDIAVLFARDPLKLTKNDIDHIIEELRKRRKQFGTIAEKAPRTSRSRTPRQTKADKLIEGLGAEDIIL